MRNKKQREKLTLKDKKFVYRQNIFYLIISRAALFMFVSITGVSILPQIVSKSAQQIYSLSILIVCIIIVYNFMERINNLHINNKRNLL